MKFTEGAFKNWGYEVAEQEFGDKVFTWAEYDRIVEKDGKDAANKAMADAEVAGKIIVKDSIADIFLQQILTCPREFDVVATMNLNGDYISDALAAQVGGIGIAPGANINYVTGHAIFEATHDVMTGVFNKRHYENKVENYSHCSSLLVIYFDVNNLKLMNDTLGHERGDYVIEKAAEYIKSLSSEENENEFDCFRMGGDEFLLVVRNRSYREMIALVNRLDEDCPVIVSADTDSIKCSVAYGYAYAKESYVYEQLLAEAEDNMYRKKYEIKQQLNMPDR